MFYWAQLSSSILILMMRFIFLLLDFTELLCLGFSTLTMLLGSVESKHSTLWGPSKIVSHLWSNMCMEAYCIWAAGVRCWCRKN